MSITVTTQAELDVVTKAGEQHIIIDSPAGVWLTLRTPESAHVEAWGSAHVEAWGSAHVVARESAHVVARGSAHVEAWGSAYVEAWESAHVVAWGSAHVVARESAHVEAWGSAHVEARGSAHVEAWGSAHVEAWGSAHVEARESAHVVARGSAHVVATAYVAVHLHSARATVEGGHIIDVSTINLEDVAVWEAYTGATMLLADDGRGFRLGTRNGRYIAGCRDFTAAEAVAHWSNPDHPASESAALLLAAVEAHLATHGDAA